MAHRRAESFKYYHWVERFYETMVKVLGQEKLDAIEEEMMLEWKAEKVAQDIKMQEAGWEKIGEGMWASKNNYE